MAAAEIYSDSTNLKLRELLNEVQLDYSPENTKIINDVVTSIREAIDKIPNGLLVGADIAPGFVRDVGADKVEFKFRKPKSVEIGGSYSFQCVAKPDVNVDIFLRLPKECFHEKDYLNYRYHAKRFLYLCVIKEHLKLSSSIQDAKWSTFHNEARKPVLFVYPVARLSDNSAFSLKIIPTAPSLFIVSKLNFERKNLRSLNQGTPKYNSSILEDMFLEDNAEIIKRTISECKELGEALLLLKVWARKKALFVHDSLSGFMITVIVTYLALNSGKNRINSSMNAMQIFRITLDFIANSKVWGSGLFFKTEGGRKISNKDRKERLKSFPVIICDSFADYNIAFRMSPSGFQELREEASLALSCMVKCRDGGFDEIFMTTADYPVKFDFCVRLNLKDTHDFHASGFCLDDECWRIYEQKVLGIIDQALKGRAKIIRAIWRNAASGCNFEDGLFMLDEEPLIIGITIGSVEVAFKQVIDGPSPEDKDKALEFRRFWGEKATQRQFLDGKIAEAAVWEHKEWNKHLIIKEIIEHVLMRHLSLPKQNIIPIVDQLDFALCQGNTDPISLSLNLLKAFDDLSKQLLREDDIPLKISKVQPLDSAFRLTSVFPPTPHPLAHTEHNKIKLEKITSTCIQPLEVILQLEGSGSWPLDEPVMEKTKSLFLLKIAESLHEKRGVTYTATEDDVYVLLSGYAFRLKILHERALSLVGKQGASQTKRVLSSDIKLLLRGQHASMINGLRGQYLIYGPVVRLAKRWVSSHLFSNFLKEEAIELLVAHLFLNPLPFSPPCSRETGFLRFLILLSVYDWSFSPLIVDINGELTPDDIKEIDEKFILNRKEYEDNLHNVSPAMFIATNYDKASEAWTRQSPTPAELRKLMAYATGSAISLKELIMGNRTDSQWESLFRTPLNNYNAVILLHREKLPYPQRLMFPSDDRLGKKVIVGKASKNFHPFLLPGDMKGNMEELKNKLMVDFDQIQCFVADIKKDFPDMKVWYDPLGGDAIGLTCGSKISRKKRGRDDKVGEEEEIDLEDALKAVGELGKGLVKSIHVLKAPKRIRS